MAVPLGCELSCTSWRNIGSDDIVQEMAIPVSWELQWCCSVTHSR